METSISKSISIGDRAKDRNPKIPQKITHSGGSKRGSSKRGAAGLSFLCIQGDGMAFKKIWLCGYIEKAGGASGSVNFLNRKANSIDFRITL